MKLVETWVQAEKRYHGNDERDALRQLNEALQMSVMQSRVAEWSRGVYLPSVPVIGYILSRALPFILHEAGCDTNTAPLEKIESYIWGSSDESADE